MTELQEKIIELRNKGLGYKAIARELDCHRDMVRKISKELGLDGIRGKKCTPKTQEEWKEIFENKYPLFKFLHNYGGIEGYNDIQCRECKTVFKHSGQDMKPSRHKEIQCPVCDRQSRKVSLSEISCKRCGKIFIGTKSHKYCSDVCRRAAKRDIEDTYWKAITLEKLYDRDKGICYICGGNCDWNDIYIDADGNRIIGPNYPTRDHVIPISKGGDNTCDNIKLAHMRCNSVKNNKIVTLP